MSRTRYWEYTVDLPDETIKSLQEESGWESPFDELDALIYAVECSMKDWHFGVGAGKSESQPTEYVFRANKAKSRRIKRALDTKLGLVGSMKEYPFDDC